MAEPSGDKLILKGLMFHGYHGAKEEEKKLGQKFAIDVDAWMDLRPAGRSDNLHDTVSYTAIYRIVKEVVEGPSRNLLESVAERISMTTLTKFPQISAVRVKVGKPHVAVAGSLDYLGVEIMQPGIARISVLPMDPPTTQPDEHSIECAEKPMATSLGKAQKLV